MLNEEETKRKPRPLSWAEQAELLPLLPPHLERMALFALNTGARDENVCGLRWAWEIRVPELGISVFEVVVVRPEHRRSGRCRVQGALGMGDPACPSWGSACSTCRRERQGPQAVADARVQQRGAVGHRIGARPARRVRVRLQRRRKDGARDAASHPIGTMNNTAWQRARREAGLGDLHVHDLRHTTGMRLREAGSGGDTGRHPVAHQPDDDAPLQRGADRRVHGALEKIKDDRADGTRASRR